MTVVVSQRLGLPVLYEVEPFSLELDCDGATWGDVQLLDGLERLSYTHNPDDDRTGYLRVELSLRKSDSPLNATAELLGSVAQAATNAGFSHLQVVANHVAIPLALQDLFSSEHLRYRHENPRDGFLEGTLSAGDICNLLERHSKFADPDGRQPMFWAYATLGNSALQHTVAPNQDSPN